MMASVEDDRRRAELQFLTARLSELSAELQQNETELGVIINDETAAQIVADVVSVLRNAGKADLAVRYEAATGRAMALIEHHQRLILQGADEQTVGAAREQQDDAIEELQRVDAEVEAFFENKRGE